jgi:xylan 1,4-beta-xylosidase
MLAALGDTELPVKATGDGADGLVQTWGSRHDDGRLAVLVWVSTLDQSKRDGDAALARHVTLTVDGAAGRAATVTRLDRAHGDVTTLAADLGIDDWPTDDQWVALSAADRLTAAPITIREDGVVEIDIPQPGAVLIEIAAERLSGDRSASRS